MTKKNEEEKTEINFETAFSRLEEIVEKLNAGSVTLDESLKLFEEADQLITLSNKRLNDAERKIEVLIKNRNGELALNAENKPVTQEFKGSK